MEIFSEGPGRTARATLVSKYITEIYFVRLSHDKVAFDVDCHVSTAIRLVFIRRCGLLFTCRCL